MESDVVIIGSGQAATPLANRLVERGQKVVVIERGDLGGTCVNTGCTPTKTMIASAQAAHVARNAAKLGVSVGDVRVDLAAVVDRKDAMVARWRHGVEKRLTGAGDRLHLVRGHGRFVDRRTVEVAGQRYLGKSVVINVGARDRIPALPGLDGVPWLNHSRLLNLRQLPGHLLVLGGGYIGCELGQMFRRFGAAVTIVGTANHLLAKEDDDVSAALEQVFHAEGIGLRLGARAVRVRGGAGLGADIELDLADGTRLVGSHLLVATGRVPNTDDLGCAAAGVALDDSGRVIADDQYRTSADGVFAVGDVLPGPQFTHVSWDDYRRLLPILTGQAEGHKGRAGQLVPYAVFTDPQVAGVGLSQREAQAQGIAHEIATLPFGSVARAIETDQTAGLLQVLVDPGSERLLGARIVGAEAGELIHVFAALMRAGASARTLVEGQMVHPAFAEGLQSVLMKLRRFA
jgi:pyruvate/2-oxoglutarate dehydrogenase complex dihydrolipoamide dehydrogenase (E3) component